MNTGSRRPTLQCAGIEQLAIDFLKPAKSGCEAHRRPFAGRRFEL